MSRNDVTAADSRHRVDRPNRLWEAVADSVLERIVAGEFPPHTTLPAEAVLCERYGVSRPSVRDAMKVLQEKGLVRIQQGVGSVVQEPGNWSALDPAVISARLRHEDADDEIFDELTVVRIALESELAALAARRVTPDSRGALTEHVQRMDATIDDPDAYLELDVAFHDLVMRFSGNRIAHAIMATIQEPLRQSRRITNRIPGGVEHAHDFHCLISKRICAGDPEGAATAMREHLTWSWERYQAMRVDGGRPQKSAD